MSAGLEAAFLEWDRGPLGVQRVRRGLDARGALALDRAADAVRREIVRRLGPSYSLADLYALYVDADAWARHVVAAAAEPTRLPTAVTPVVDAAFGYAARSARDRR